MKPTPAQSVSRVGNGVCPASRTSATVAVTASAQPVATRPWLAWRSDAGSGGTSLTMLIAAVALMMILGLVVDGGAKARALDHAGAIASEAARAAAATYRPGDIAIDPQAADKAAQDYLTAAGATGTVTVAGLDVAATATLHQPTVFLSLVGIDAFTVTGAGRAQVVYQQGGTP